MGRNEETREKGNVMADDALTPDAQTDNEQKKREEEEKKREEQKKFIEWHAERIRRYGELRELYEAYADFIEKVLKAACKTLAPLGIVQARAKTLSSFAGKAARKRVQGRGYERPEEEFTDLCGGRVIVCDLREIEGLRRFVRENFVVDEANTDDISARLGESEFGYLSVHFVVTLPEGATEVYGVEVPEAIRDRGLRAEIQIRTMLQHAWSDLTHDRLYKSPFEVPRRLRREGASLAATLEVADGRFRRFVEDIDSYTANYAAYMDAEAMGREIRALGAILTNDPDPANKAAQALRLACIAIARGQEGDFDLAIGTLQDVICDLGRRESTEPYGPLPLPEEDAKDVLAATRFEEEPRGGSLLASHPLRGDLIVTLGEALSRHYRNSRENEDFKKATALLRSVAPSEKEETERSETETAALAPEAFLATCKAKACHLMAWIHSLSEWTKHRARSRFRQALRLDPDNPYYFCSMLEYETYISGGREVITAMRPAVLQAISVCRKHADAGIELPAAFFTMGRLYLMLEEKYPALHYYAKGIHFALRPEKFARADVFVEELRSLGRINVDRELPPAHEAIQRMLLLAIELGNRGAKDGNRFEEDDEDPEAKPVRDLALRAEAFAEPVLVVAGGAAPFEESARSYHELLVAALKDLSGTVISGGTKAGIPGEVGRIAHELDEAGRKGFDLLGYLPPASQRPADAPDSPYYVIVPTGGHGFGPLDPVQMWIDLYARGVDLASVKILGINGGPITHFEYYLGLAMGATVGIIDSSGRAAADIAQDVDLRGVAKMMMLPFDRETVWAFTHPRVSSPLDIDDVEKLAQQVHEGYRRENKKNIQPEACREWPDLSDELKESNREQVRFALAILREAGFDIRKAGPGALTAEDFTDDDLKRMARLEHGRWCAERLQAGWRYGEEKDEKRKINPYLVPWEALPKPIAEWDIGAVKKYPDHFAVAGYGIFRTRHPVGGKPT